MEKNKYLIVVVVIAVLLVGVGGFIVYDNFANEDNGETNKDSNTDTDTVDTNVKRNKLGDAYFEVSSGCKDGELEQTCSKELVVNGNKTKISVMDDSVIDIGNNKIYIPSTEYVVSIEVFKDLLIIGTMSSEADWYPRYDIINSDGVVVFTTRQSDFGFKNMHLGESSAVRSSEDTYNALPVYTIKDNKLELFVTRKNYYFPDEVCSLYFTETPGLNVVIEKANYSNIKDDPYTAKLEIEYLGNGAFTEPKMVSSTKIKDYKEIDTCLSR